jgi:hypothetical protein
VSIPSSNSNNVTYRLPPKPQRWCWYSIKNINVPRWYQEAWQTKFGVNYMWVVRGITEAVERISEDGSYAWLPLMPLLSKFVMPVKSPL